MSKTVQVAEGTEINTQKNEFLLSQSLSLKKQCSIRTKK